MSLTNIIPQTDHIANACSAIDAKYLALLNNIVQTLEDSISLIDRNDNFTANDFWARQGANGVNLITTLATWRGILSQYAPELVNDRIAEAGSTLKISPDGIVSVSGI